MSKASSELPARGRIALLHFTVAPSVGGIEQLIDAQSSVLTSGGYDVRLICGQGSKPRHGELIRLPELHPAHHLVRQARAACRDSWPSSDHPLVRKIAADVRRALHGCEQCWVHNAFTVFLHPFLTVALRSLVEELPSIAWVAWCEDISSVSSYWRRPPTACDDPWIDRALPGVTYVAISRSRQRELTTVLSIPPAQIPVIPPPLDYAVWLHLGRQTISVAQRLQLDTADPLVLVPAKLLPHKNLGLAVRVARELQMTTPRPVFLLTAANSPHENVASRQVRRDLETLAAELGDSETVRFLPDLSKRRISHRTVHDLMLLCDLVFLPSAEEGFGMPIREAAALRVPVVCADIPAFRESGGGSARQFALTDSPHSVAQQVREVSELPINRARREAIRSFDRFREDITRLARRNC